MRKHELIPGEVLGVTYQPLTQEEFREKLPIFVDKWKKNRDRESLVWLYAEVVGYPDRCELKARKDVVRIFGEPDVEDSRILGYEAKDGFYSVNFETEDDDAKTIIGWSKQP